MAEGFRTNIMQPISLDTKTTPAEGWKLWKQMWNNYSIITKLADQNKQYQTALFLHAVGPDALTIHNGFQFAPTEDKDDVDTVIAKFDQHFIGQINETYERYFFNKRDQEPGETIDSYITLLRNSAKSCNFCECLHDSLLRDRIVLARERQSCP